MTPSPVRPVKKKERKSTPKVSALAFSHLPPAVARECAELTAKVWTELEKAAARARIEDSNSARVKKAEQEKLDRALHAEARLLRLMEERGDKPAGHRERQQRHRTLHGEGEELLWSASSRLAPTLLLSLRGNPMDEGGESRGVDDGVGEVTGDEVGDEDGHVNGQREGYVVKSEEGNGSSSSPSAMLDGGCWTSSAGRSTPAGGPSGHAWDLRRRIFSPTSATCEEAFSTFVQHVRAGPADAIA